jgi:glycine cleavage system H protein
MSNVPADLSYAKSHEWVRFDADGTATIGITDYAQSSLGDITFVQVPKVGTQLKAGAVFGVVESVKAASDLYCPVDGVLTSVNQALESSPETVNSDPYGAGWMLKVRLEGASRPEGLLDASGYGSMIA